MIAIKFPFPNNAFISDSNTLLDDLFSGYNVDVRPVKNKGPIPRLRISISIRIAYPDKKWNMLNNVGAILVGRISIQINLVRKQRACRITQ